MHTGHGVTDEYTPLEQRAELFITAVHFGAPSMSLWCRWAASASAGVLFIYTSYKSVSPELQHKLHQASGELMCVNVSTHTHTQKKPLQRMPCGYWTYLTAKLFHILAFKYEIFHMFLMCRFISRTRSADGIHVFSLPTPFSDSVPICFILLSSL